MMKRLVGSVMRCGRAEVVVSYDTLDNRKRLVQKTYRVVFGPEVGVGQGCEEYPGVGRLLGRDLLFSQVFSWT